MCDYRANDRDLKTLAPYSAGYYVNYKLLLPRMNDDARRL